MISYRRVKLYSACRFKTFTGSPVVYTAFYTEEGLHKPLFEASSRFYLPDSNYLIYNSGSQPLCPRTGHEFDEIELPIDYNEINGLTGNNSAAKFVALEFGYETGKTFEIYGWIDSIEPLAVKGPSANCRIRWHVDHWLSAQHFANFYNVGTLTGTRTPITYGAGRIKRGPSGLARPDPSAPRKWVSGDSVRICDDADNPQLWIILQFVDVVSTGITRISTYFWPEHVTVESQGQNYYSLSIEECYSGFLEEALGIDPDDIIGCWVSPIEPYDRTGTGTDAVYQNFDSDHHTWYYVQATRLSGRLRPINKTISLIDAAHPNGYASDDLHKLQIVDPFGCPMASIPWGFTITEAVINIDAGVSSANLNIWCKTATSVDYLKDAAEGLVVTIPLPKIPITSNAWSSYVYSGQRTYDIEQRRLQREQNCVQGISGAGTSAIGGAMMGTLVTPGLGTLLGAGAGLATSLIGTAVNTFTSNDIDRKAQDASDRLVSNQSANIIDPAGGALWFNIPGAGYYFIEVVRDAESAAELSDEQSELGYVTDSYKADCTTILRTGGGLRIEGLEVKGDIPPEGRAYIAALFARGVHLDLIQ